MPDYVLRYAAPSWMRTCLSSVPVLGSVADATAALIRAGLSQSCALCGLAADSGAAAAEAALAGAPTNGSVFPSRVDVLGAVDAALAGSVMPGSPVGERQHSAFQLHYGLAAALHSLRDAHTHYLTPFYDWSLHRAVVLWPHLMPGGAQVYILVQAPEWTYMPGGLNEAVYTAVHGLPPPQLEAYQGKIVTHVNGKPAGEHLQARADAAASMRDAGARLNFLLGHHAAEVLDIYPPPPLDEEVFTFADGSQATWKLTVMQMGADDPLVAKQQMLEAYSISSHVLDVERMFTDITHQYGRVWGPLCPDDNCEAGPALNSSATAAQRLEAWADMVERHAAELPSALGAPQPQDSASQGGHPSTGVVMGKGGATGGGGDPSDQYHPYGDYGDYDDEVIGGGAAAGNRRGGHTGWVGAGEYYPEGDDDYYAEDESAGGGGCSGYDDGYGGYDYDEFSDSPTGGKELPGGVTQVAVFYDATSEPFLGVYHVAGDVRADEDAMVLKVATLAPEGGPFAALPSLLRVLMRAMRLADQYATARGVSRLLIDLSSNTGGDAIAAYFLLALLQPEAGNSMATLCDAATIRASPLADFLAAPRKAGAVLRTAVADAAPADVIAASTAALRVVDAVRRAVATGIEAWGEEAGLDVSMVDVKIVERETAQLREALATAERTREDFDRAPLLDFLADGVDRLLLSALGRSDGSVDGGMKHAVGESKELKGTGWYWETARRRQLGGVTFPQPFHTAACQLGKQWFRQISAEPKSWATLSAESGPKPTSKPLAEAEPGSATWSPWRHRFSQLAVLSDGTCSGACATVATRLGASRSALTISYGGQLGGKDTGAMDLSASGGSTSGEWDYFSRDTTLAVMASALLGYFQCDASSDTKSAGQCRQPDFFSVVPVHPPSGATLRWTLNNVYEPHLGPAALPRQLYRLPADVHLRLWVRFPRLLPSLDRASGAPVNMDSARAWRDALPHLGRGPVLADWAPASWNSSAWQLQQPQLVIGTMPL
eukprot:jgi/Tetstr1/432480/TSEL_021856.t1